MSHKIVNAKRGILHPWYGPWWPKFLLTIYWHRCHKNHIPIHLMSPPRVIGSVEVGARETHEEHLNSWCSDKNVACKSIQLWYIVSQIHIWSMINAIPPPSLSWVVWVLPTAKCTILGQIVVFVVKVIPLLEKLWNIPCSLPIKKTVLSIFCSQVGGPSLDHLCC